jgi:glycosyltransferase involved in cell wall biosynthesis
MLSIIIPTLNEEKYLPKLLEDIREQTFSNYEIIVSDGCSDDGTVEIARSYGCKVVTGDKNKRHPSFQRNDGAKVAQGELLLFLDADTLFDDKNFLEKTIKSFSKKKLGIAGFCLKFKSNKFFYLFYYCFYNGFSFLAQYIKPLAVGAAIIVRKDMHDKIGGFDTSIFIGEDQVYCEKISKMSKFRIIRGVKIFFSIRRFEKEGRWKLFFKLIYSTLYVLLFGPIKKKIVKYDFGNYK